jgi:hypothetical protein
MAATILYIWDICGGGYTCAPEIGQTEGRAVVKRPHFVAITFSIGLFFRVPKRILMN